MMKIGILGGTYNPPHIGHLHAAALAREQLGLSKIILVPANIPPHKELPSLTPSASARLEMTRIAARQIDAEVCDIELKRQGVSYTADTVEEFASIYEGAEIYFIVGTDMFVTLEDWFQPERIFKAAKIAVVARNDGDEKKISEHMKVLSPLGARVSYIRAQALPISSTELRYDMASFEKYLPEGVFEYIKREHLYGF